MKAEQVDQALLKKFMTEKNRLVFWNDTDGEFSDYIEAGLPTDLQAVTVIDSAKLGGFSTKLLLEREDTSGKYLVYSTGELPPPDEDWLLDIRHYSAEFHADVATIWLEELGLKTLSLRDHLKARAVFLGNQDRRKKLKRLVSSDDDEAAIDLKIMAVLAGSDVANLFSIVQALCHGHTKDGRFELDEQPKAIGLFEKMGLLEGFWALVKREFFWTHENPTVSGLVRHLFVSDLFNKTEGAQLNKIAQFNLLPAGRQNAMVCLTQWRDSSGKSESYDATAGAVASELKLRDLLSNLSIEYLAEVYTFWEAELQVVSALKKKVLEEARTVDVDQITELARERQAGYWLAGPKSDQPKRLAVADAYDAIVAAAGLFSLRTRYEHGLDFESPEALISAYQDELFRFDQLYRRFYFKAKAAQGQGWDLLKTLAEEVERVYDQGFLQPLGLEWGRLLDEGFLGTWKLPKMPAQQDFYSDSIEPYLAYSDKKRAYVIISDAFRYEAAQELTETLKGRYRMDAHLSGLLGVLPSYTSLGKASLLPHQTLTYSDKGDVLVDGKSTAGTEARNKLLHAVEGMACQARDLLKMTQEDARSFTQGKRVVYIFHDVIDDRVDGKADDGGTFAAVDECIGELVELVKFCVNRFNAKNVWVTADHGFLYQEEDPGETDKSELKHKPENAVKANKRYVLGRGMGTSPEAHHGTTRVTAGTDDAMDFWVPRGANRFHFIGGARFIHGGAMPQEVVVPLITVIRLRGEEAAKSKSKKVLVKVLGDNHKITAPKHRFELIQTEQVSERRKPITLKVAVYDGTNAVTSVDTVVFDITSDSIEERTKPIILELHTGEYDKSKPYRLVLRDAETDTEVQAVQVVIDRSFNDDF